MNFFKKFFRNKHENILILVEGGTFLMGATPEQQEGAEEDEKPVHKVTLSSYYIGKYQVTQDLWVSVMGDNPSIYKGSKKPVENVSWYDIVEFCNKLSDNSGFRRAFSGSGNNITCDFSATGYRLPTEAEWEYAARGGEESNGYEYSGNNDIGEVAWYKKNSGGNTHDAGTKRPNELGIYDMTGNVWEWCWNRGGGKMSGVEFDPKGPNSGSSRVYRGGCWNSRWEGCCVEFGSNSYPEYRSATIGFRIVRKKS